MAWLVPKLANRHGQVIASCDVPVLAMEARASEHDAARAIIIGEPIGRVELAPGVFVERRRMVPLKRRARTVLRSNPALRRRVESTVRAQGLRAGLAALSAAVWLHRRLGHAPRLVRRVRVRRSARSRGPNDPYPSRRDTRSLLQRRAA